jgi:hypothetical protein
MKGAKLTMPKSLNRYSYVGGDPVNFKDASGEDWIDWRFFLTSVCNGGYGTIYSNALMSTGTIFCGDPREVFSKKALEDLGEYEQRKGRKGLPVTCEIAVVATRVPNTITVGQHTAIFTRESGQTQWTVFEAGPSGTGPIDWGVLESKGRQDNQNYRIPNNADAFSLQPGSCQKFNDSFEDSTNKINNEKLAYFPLSIPGVATALNSNSFVFTLLLRAGLDPGYYKKELDKKLTTANLVPGWGRNIL